MTKEEYEKLLKSDYWKGYSYSLIKERDFTCEDCGKRFYNERNKLQVHHLVYRDVNPWSYKPEELVVLCEECHKKRHGIPTEPTTDTATSDTGNRYEKAPSFSSNTASVHFDTRIIHADKTSSRFAWPEEEERRFKFKYVVYGLLILLALSFGYEKLHDQEQIEENVEETRRNTEMQESDVANRIDKRSVVKKKRVPIKQDVSTEDAIPIDPTSITVQSNVADGEPAAKTPKISIETSVASSSDENLSAIELLERRNHEEVVKQAKRAGVSTSGSTTDILERINHAEVVKQAKRAGVSTEGSTTDILERINHAEVVKQAKRAGVSTEGSTSDILERITRKSLESR